MRHLCEVRVAGGQPHGWSTGTYAVFEASFHGHNLLKEHKDLDDAALVEAKVCPHMTILESFFGAWVLLKQSWPGDKDPAVIEEWFQR